MHRRAERMGIYGVGMVGRSAIDLKEQALHEASVPLAFTGWDGVRRVNIGLGWRPVRRAGGRTPLYTLRHWFGMASRSSSRALSPRASRLGERLNAAVHFCHVFGWNVHKLDGTRGSRASHICDDVTHLADHSQHSQSQHFLVPRLMCTARGSRIVSRTEN